MMANPQKLKFVDVEDFLTSLPENELRIVESLRHLIFDSIPVCREKLAYNVPFYYRHARICYLWPASVPWGKVPTHSVSLGFVNGNLLQDETSYLEKSARKQVYVKSFADVSEIDDGIVKALLYEAYLIDELIQKEEKKH